MYMLSDTTEYEFPIAVYDRISELAKALNSTIPDTAKTVRRGSTTKLFDGRPAKIYKIKD